MADASKSVFQTKYEEFGNELLQTFPELEAEIRAALGLSEEERLREYKGVQPPSPGQSGNSNPGRVFPGITLSDTVWNGLSPTNQEAILEYVKLLSVCYFLEAGFGGEDVQPEWMHGAMDDLKKKLEGVDFEAMMKKFVKIFGFGVNSDGGGGEGGGEGGESNENETKRQFPKIPERFLKGHLARFAEEIVRSLKPEDFGLTPEVIEECEKSPSRALDILMNVLVKNPGVLQTAVQKIGKSLAKKVQSGQIRPQEILREMEELMKDFSSMPEFVDMMGTMKNAFGFDDMIDISRRTGNDSSARLSLVQQRLRKKLDARKQGK